MDNRADQWDRRKFLHGLTLAGTAGLVGLRPGLALAEPPPETTRVRFGTSGAICVAPELVAKELRAARALRMFSTFRRRPACRSSGPSSTARPTSTSQPPDSS